MKMIGKNEVMVGVVFKLGVGAEERRRDKILRGRDGKRAPERLSQGKRVRFLARDRKKIE